MTSKQTEALKLALDALEYISSHYMSLPKIGCMALAAVEEALAEQPAQPKGCQCPACKVTPHASDCAVHNEPAYQKGSCDCGAQQWNAGVPSLYPEPEPGVSIKATYEQPAPVAEPHKQQEPVAFLVEGLHEGVVIAHQIYFTVDEAKKTAAVFAQHYPTINTKPIYTSPPASKPLTNEEIVEIELGLRQYNNRDTYDLSLKDFARAIEAAHGIKE